MDLNSIYFLLSRGDGGINQIFICLLLPVLQKIVDFIISEIYSFYSNYILTYFKKEIKGSISGEITINDWNFSENQLTFSNISKYIVEQNKGIALLSISRNQYIINSVSDVDLGNDILISVYIQKDAFSDKKMVVEFYIYSRSKDTESIKLFIDNINRTYNDVLRNKYYHFIYKASNEITFTSTLLFDMAPDGIRNHETFDNIFNEHKEKIKKSIDKLKDIEYYKKHGIKRKKGFLFYGEPGCGKTYTVMAMANYSKRSIIEIPMSRITNESVIEDIITKTVINGKTLRNDEIIILFDEIDRGNVEGIFGDEKPKVPFIGTLLSRLDGIGNYDGIIFVATTNNIDNIDPALYRPGRLDPICFTYLRKVDIKDMIEKAFDVTLTDDEIEKLPDINDKVKPSFLKSNIICYEDIKECLQFVYTLKTSVDTTEEILAKLSTKPNPDGFYGLTCLRPSEKLLRDEFLKGFLDEPLAEHSEELPNYFPLIMSEMDNKEELNTYEPFSICDESDNDKPLKYEKPEGFNYMTEFGYQSLKTCIDANGGVFEDHPFFKSDYEHLGELLGETLDEPIGETLGETHDEICVQPIVQPKKKDNEEDWKSTDSDSDTDEEDMYDESFYH